MSYKGQPQVSSYYDLQLKLEHNILVLNGR